jgi:hypothetical protein
MMLLRKAHLGEVTVSVWPQVLKEICAKKNIHVLNLIRKNSECGQPVKALTEPVARFFGSVSSGNFRATQFALFLAHSSALSS